MTVRILSAEQKQAVVVIYTSTIKPKSIPEIAGFLGVSTRTIGRVIEEVGLQASKKVHTGDTAKIMALLYKHKITLEQLELMFDEFPNTMRGTAKVAAIKLQEQRTRKSPQSHNGKQVMLPMNLPVSLELH